MMSVCLRGGRGEVRTSTIKARQGRAASLYHPYDTTSSSGLLHRPSPARPLLAIEAPPGEKKEEETEDEDQLEDNTALAVVEEHIFEHLPPRLNQGMNQRERAQAIFLCYLIHFRGLLGCVGIACGWAWPYPGIELAPADG